jgi:predicted AAA+ superfamily ATPase
VDFAVKDGLKLNLLIQVCYAVNNHITKKREVNALLKAAAESRCKHLIVITWDYEAKETLDDIGVHYLPLWKWLISSR